MPPLRTSPQAGEGMKGGGRRGAEIPAREFLHLVEVIFVGMCGAVIHFDSPMSERVPMKLSHLSPTLQCHSAKANPLLRSVPQGLLIARLRGGATATRRRQNQNEI